MSSFIWLQQTARRVRQLLKAGVAQIMHVNELIENPAALQEYNMLLIPGGFSFGDDLGSGEVLAINSSLD